MFNIEPSTVHTTIEKCLKQGDYPSDGFYVYYFLPHHLSNEEDAQKYTRAVTERNQKR